MGIFSKFLAGADTDLLQNGVLGRGLIKAVQISGGTTQIMGGLVERNCTFTVQVMLDGREQYIASCRQRIGEIYLPQIQPDATVVAVRVDPNDPQKIAIDFNTPPPEVRMPAGSAPSAALILESGTPAKAVIVASQPMGVKNATGVDMYAFTLTVMISGQAPYQIQVGNPTPPEAIPLLFPGSHLVAKVGELPNYVAIDWPQSIAAASA